MIFFGNLYLEDPHPLFISGKLFSCFFFGNYDEGFEVWVDTERTIKKKYSNEMLHHRPWCRLHQFWLWTFQQQQKREAFLLGGRKINKNPLMNLNSNRVIHFRIIAESVFVLMKWGFHIELKKYKRKFFTFYIEKNYFHQKCFN